MQWVCTNMCNTFELCSCLRSFRLKYLWHHLRYALDYVVANQALPIKCTNVTKTIAKAPTLKHRISYNCYAVNTSAAVQQCVLYRTSSIFKVGFSSILVRRVTFMPSSDHVCPIDDTTVTCTEVVWQTLRS